MVTNRRGLFDLEKAIQAVGVILREEHDHRMNYMKLLKLISIAERETLKETGAMITGDIIIAMEHGPLPSRIYDLIRGIPLGVSSWDKFIERHNFDVALVANPGVGKLSRFEISKLREVVSRYARYNERAMAHITHDFPEWIKNEPRKGSSAPIPTEDILDAVGRRADAKSIIREANEQRRIDVFFTRMNACSDGYPTP